MLMYSHTIGHRLARFPSTQVHCFPQTPLNCPNRRCLGQLFFVDALENPVRLTYPPWICLSDYTITITLSAPCGDVQHSHVSSLA
jgi:hypothetical protein